MTSKEQVLEQLRSGNELSPQEIGRACHIQHNTAIKDIKFLRDDGYQIEKRRVVDGDTEYYRYRLVGVRNDPSSEVVVTGQPGSGLHQEATLCACGNSYYTRNGRCNRCGVAR